MTDRRLAANVIIGETAYRAGSVPPPDIAERITNPDAWEPQEAAPKAENRPPEGAGVALAASVEDKRGRSRRQS